MFWAEIWEISEFLSENIQFLVVKFSIYLNRRVFVMCRISYYHVRNANTQISMYMTARFSHCAFCSQSQDFVYHMNFLIISAASTSQRHLRFSILLNKMVDFEVTWILHEEFLYIVVYKSSEIISDTFWFKHILLWFSFSLRHTLYKLDDP